MEQLGMASQGHDESAIRTAGELVLENHWMPEGYAAPHVKAYPWQWLWDSCFHVLIWRALGRDDRAQKELATIFVTQAPSGFVPHINYARKPGVHAELWGRCEASSITQPPMYGHAIADLVRAGSPPPDGVLADATAGLQFLLEQRARDDSGLILLCHPWESGADDSPRWDDCCPKGFEVDRWRREKNRLVSRFKVLSAGSPFRNPEFPVASVGFNALVAYNALELSTVTGNDILADSAKELTNALEERWEGCLGTWVAAGPTSGGSGRYRTVDALLPLLVTDSSEKADRVLSDLCHSSAYGGPYGPAGVHRSETSFDPEAYWRGAVWPQLAYLLVVAAARFDSGIARELAAKTVSGALASGLAEYWHPDTGQGFGAIPQSWAGLALPLALR